MVTTLRLPESFITYTRQLLGEELYARYEKALGDEATTSIRINCDKGATPPEDGRKVAWCDTGFYLGRRPNFTLDPMLHAGMYYVQEASSMFVDKVIRTFVNRPADMLDMCAAPGGKTTAARAALPEGSTLVCNEPVKLRAQILAENIAKWGHPGVAVTNNYPRDFARSRMTFDVILCDVPCSGEGMFRKDAGAAAEWSVQGVEKCRQLQREIVADAWQCLKDDGLLIYSTCTLNTKENEENVRWIAEELGGEVLDVGADSSWGIQGSMLEGFAMPVYRFIPGLTQGEGLFMATVRKHGGGSDGSGRHKGRRSASRNMTAEAKRCMEWLHHPDRFVFEQSGDAVRAIPDYCTEAFGRLDEARLHVIAKGIGMAQIKGKDIIPAHPLALSTAFNRGAFATCDLDYATAIAYLRREATELPADTPKGYVAVTYRGTPLGFVKNIGNRTNNMYPKEWRVLTRQDK